MKKTMHLPGRITLCHATKWLMILVVIACMILPTTTSGQDSVKLDSVRIRVSDELIKLSRAMASGSITGVRGLETAKFWEQVGMSQSDAEVAARVFVESYNLVISGQRPGDKPEAAELLARIAKATSESTAANRRLSGTNGAAVDLVLLNYYEGCLADKYRTVVFSEDLKVWQAIINTVVDNPGETGVSPGSLRLRARELFESLPDSIEKGLNAPSTTREEHNEFIENAVREYIKLLKLDIEYRGKPDPLSDFFQGPWTNFVVALANDQPVYDHAVKLAEASKEISPELHSTMSELYRAIGKLEDEEVGTRLLSSWSDFVETYLLENGYYGTLSISRDLSNGITSYFPVIYRVGYTSDRRIPLPDGEEKVIQVVRGRKVDRVNTIGAMGHSVHGEMLIFIDESAVDSAVRKIRETLRGEAYELIGGSRVSSPQLNRWVQDRYEGRSDQQLTVAISKALEAHEIGHKVKELADLSYRLDRRIGLSETDWNRYPDRFRESIEHEYFAYLSELALSDEQGLVLIGMTGHLLGGRGTPHYFASRFITNELAERAPDEWVDWKDAEGAVRAVVDLLESGESVIREKALVMMRVGFGETAPIAVQAALDSAVDTGER